jgi:hypothetical protein
LEFNENENSITVYTDKVAKDVYISVDSFDLKLSDNYFDILPDSKVVLMLGNG